MKNKNEVKLKFKNKKLKIKIKIYRKITEIFINFYLNFDFKITNLLIHFKCKIICMNVLINI